MKTRSAVFIQRPQAVEVYQAGAWWAGELLGWRHEADGSCRMQVRVVLGGAEETAWVDIAGLRLPEPGCPPATAMRADRDAGATQKLPRASAPRQERPSPGPEVPALAGTRELAAAARPGGRRRAPEDPAPSSASVTPRRPQGGRRRAPDVPGTSVMEAAAPAPPGSGRRRAPDVDESTAGAAGRHRAGAPAGAGRHRTADTGLLAAVATGKAPAGPAPAVPLPRRADLPRPSARASWTAGGAPEPEFLTRPMRLTDAVPHTRARRDGTLSTA